MTESKSISELEKLSIKMPRDKNKTAANNDLLFLLGIFKGGSGTHQAK